MAVTYVQPLTKTNNHGPILTVYCRSGAKCLPSSQISKCRGLVLHDCHAEILAIRAFNYWLLQECRGVLASPESSSPYIRYRQHPKNEKPQNEPWPPLELHPDVRIYMYCTCAPCGDASMELCMAAQEDPTPWELPPPLPPPSSLSSLSSSNVHLDTQDAALAGRAHFSLLGVVRRKPARMDAESTRSKSCSDKLALRQVSSLLSHETSLFVVPTENAYLEGVILPEEEISRVACERAFGAMGRMKALNERASWPLQHFPNCHDEDGRYGYRFRPFKVLSIPAGQIEIIWPFRKPLPSPNPHPLTSCSSTEAKANPSSNSRKSKPSTVSAIWAIAPSHHTPTPDHNPKSLPKLRGSNTGLYETVTNGVKQGNRASAPSARGASALSRARLWTLVRDVILMMHGQDMGQDRFDLEGMVPPWREVLEASTYSEFKIGASGVREQAIKDAKEVLKGWLPNSGDENWGLDVLIDPKKQKR